MSIRRNKTILEQAADYVEAAVETAQDKAGPVLADAKDAAGTAFADVREQAGPTLTDARDKVVPILAAGAAIAAEKISAAADLAAEKAAEGKEVAAAKAAELNTETKKSHRLRNLLIITGIAALIGFAAKKMRSGSDKENWQSSYSPTPAPAPRATDTPIADAAAASTEGADEGGAGPDEALADAVEESHDVTTPDDPADIVALEPDEEAAKKS